MWSFAFLAVAIGRKLGTRSSSCLFLVDWCGCYDIMVLIDVVSGGHCCNSYPQLVRIEAFCVPWRDGFDSKKGKLCSRLRSPIQYWFYFWWGKRDSVLNWATSIGYYAATKWHRNVAGVKILCVEHANMSRCQMRILGVDVADENRRNIWSMNYVN